MAHPPDDGDVIVEEGSASACGQGEAEARGISRPVLSSQEANRTRSRMASSESLLDGRLNGTGWRLVATIGILNTARLRSSTWACPVPYRKPLTEISGKLRPWSG
jgi:hypothetical protein